MAKKRAMGITNQEISISFWVIGFVCQLFTIKLIWGLYTQAPLGDFILMLFLLSIASFFFFLAPMWMNYLISKFELDLFINKITNPDFIGWIRFTKSKMCRLQIVKKGPLGQTMGLANDAKADIINQGDYTITTPSGNQALIMMDMLSHNVNLEKNVGWNLINKHFGTLGFKACEKAMVDGKTIYPMAVEVKEESKEEKKEEVKEEGEHE